MKRERTRYEIPLLIALLVVAVFAVDLTAGPEISFSIFYLIPIALATWFGSRKAGLLLSLFCALGWLLGEQLAGASYSSAIVAWWNMFARLGLFIIVTQTLASRRRIEAELVRARADALAAHQTKSEFLNRVTHELRTPLTAILGFADILQKRSGPFLTTPDQECLRRIRANSESLLALVDGVLDIGRAEARRQPPNVVPVDVAALLESVATDMRGRLLRSGVALHVHTAANLKLLQSDPALLRQILLNLVSNAAKFTEQGAIHLRVAADPQGTPLRIDIQDTGIGIPAEKLAAIFEPFEQADGSIHRRFGGAGLGLTIANDLCAVIGCTLEVKSEAGVGSTFSVVLRSEMPASAPNNGQFVNTQDNLLFH